MQALEVNYRALYQAIIYYREITTATALDVAEGLYRLAPSTKVITVESVRRIIKCLDNKLFSNLGRLEVMLRIGERTILKLYLLYKLEIKEMADRGEEAIMDDEDLEEIIHMVQQGIPMYKLCKIAKLPERHLLKMIDNNKYNYAKAAEAISRHSDDEDIRVNELARRYYESFKVGDMIIMMAKSKTQVKVRIIFKNTTYFQVMVGNKRFSISFQDILSKNIKIKQM